MPKAAALYCRISADKAGEGLGVRRQEDDCRVWCEKRGWPIREVFVDNDLSAYSGKRRPGFERMVDEIKAGRLDAIVVWHPDRLTRSTKELEGIIDLVEATGVAVGTVTAGDYDLTTPEGRLTARIVGAVARKESEDKSRRLRRKHVELAERGVNGSGGTRPFGFEADRVTVNEREARFVREAAARILAGETLRGICADWGRREVSTVTGVGWSTFTLRRLLLSGRIAGLREHRGVITATAEWPAIISPEDHARLTAVLNDPTRRTNHGATRYLLSGFVYCQVCGATTKMVARPTEFHRRRYVCATGPGSTGCGKCYIVAEELEDLISAAVIEAIAGPVLTDAMVKAETSPGDDDALAEIAAIEQRQADLAAMWAAGEIGKVEWSAARAGLDKRLEAARARVAADTAPRALVGLPANVEALRELWDDEDFGFDRRRAIIAAVVDKVVIGPGRRGYNRFDATRVDIVWRA